MPTEMNQAGIDMLCELEEFSKTPYLCPAKIATIGIGTTIYPNGKHVTMQDQPITKNQAIEYVKDYLQQIYKWLHTHLKWIPNQNQFNALCSFLYNTGIGSKFNSYVNTKNAIITGDLQGITEGMFSVNNHGLLTSRRIQEVRMFNLGCA